MLRKHDIAGSNPASRTIDDYGGDTLNMDNLIVRRAIWQVKVAMPEFCRSHDRLCREVVSYRH